MREIALAKHDLCELTEAVLERGGFFRLKAYGHSMYPFILDGDTIVLGPMDHGSITVGAVVLFRSRSGGLSAHRVVAFECETTDSRGKILVQGDEPGNAPEAIEVSRVLGRVLAVERGEKPRIMQRGIKGPTAWAAARFRRVSRWFAAPGEFFKSTAAGIVVFLQGFPVYRLPASRVVQGKIEYRVAHVVDGPALARFYRYRGLQGIGDPSAEMERELLMLAPFGDQIIAVRREAIVGSVVVRRFPPGAALYPDWWLFGLAVRIMFRGAGIGEKLVWTALERAAARGAARVHVLVESDNRPALKLYEKLGFMPASIPSIEHRIEEEFRNGAKRQVILAHCLPVIAKSNVR